MPVNKSLKKQNQALSFQVVFSSEPSAGSEVLWHESKVKVIEDDTKHDERPDSGPSQCAPPPQISIKVTSAPAPEFLAQNVTSEVKDLCSSITKAKDERKTLQLYLNHRHTFRCDHVASHEVPSLSGQATNTISLEALLSASAQTNDQSKRMPPIKFRLLLALNLASTLLQMNATPWFATLWSKSSIYFLAPRPLLNYSQIDLTRPLISVKFSNGISQSHCIKFSEARRVILELGIMLLELWHQTTLEAHYADSGITVSDDYFDRVKWAQIWLENSDDSGLILPTYTEFVARCIKCNFGTTSLNPTWDSDLIQGIIEGVIVPLQAMCKPTRY